MSTRALLPLHRGAPVPATADLADFLTSCPCGSCDPMDEERATLIGARDLWTAPSLVRVLSVEFDFDFGDPTASMDAVPFRELP